MKGIFLLSTAGESIQEALDNWTGFRMSDTLAQALTRGITSLLIALAAAAVYQLVKRVLRHAPSLSKSQQNCAFLLRLCRTVCIVVAALLIFLQFDALRTLALSLLTGTGVVALCIGLASQEVVANLVSGAFLMVNRPFVIGDRIRIPEKNVTGVVENVTLRHTVIRTVENTAIILPNSMANTLMIENITDAQRVFAALEIGVSYDADLTLAKRIMARQIAAHPAFLDVRTPEQIDQGAPPVTVLVKDLGDSAVTLRAVFWTADLPSQVAMLSDLRQSVKAEFDRVGVEIPFPQRVVHFKTEPEKRA